MTVYEDIRTFNINMSMLFFWSNEFIVSKMKYAVKMLTPVLKLGYMSPVHYSE